MFEREKTHKWIFVFLLLLTVNSFALASRVIYVDDDAAGANDGSSWQNAYIYLQDALTDAKNSEKPIDIRVAQGTYKPDQGAGITAGDREATFELVNDVNLVGSYAGILEPDPNTRDSELFKTILSGDLADNDIDVNDPSKLLEEPTRTENSYNVITCTESDSKTILDSFIITAGNANGTTESTKNGGGMYIYNNNPTIVNCTFIKNSAHNGAGTFNYKGKPDFINCTFTKNAAKYLGGGMRNNYNTASIKNCTFNGNTAGNHGAGVFNYHCNSIITNCLFTYNTSRYDGGGLYNDTSDCNIANCTFTMNLADEGGGAKNNDSNSIFTDCVFNKNSAFYGGGIYNDGFRDISFINCTFIENTSEHSGGGMLNKHSSPKVTNCSFSSNIAEIEGGGVRNWFCTPEFVNCIFSDNETMGDGGGMLNDKSDSILDQNVFNHNSASSGAGVYNYNCNSKITNCTFNDNNASSTGGGICNIRSNSIVTQNTFNNNSAYSGGAIDNSDRSDSTITNCILSGNVAEYLGGGICNNVDSHPSINNCVISGNISQNKGGGIYTDSHRYLILSNCIFSGNLAKDSGGGIFINNRYKYQYGYYESSSLDIINCTFYLNSGTQGNAFACSSEPKVCPGIIQVKNCIIWDSSNEIYNGDDSNIMVTYSNVLGGYSGDGNIETDPLFADTGYWDSNQTPNDSNDDFWVEGDYHLKSTAGRWDESSQTWVIDEVMSPCIDTGDIISPICYELDPHGGIINMGAFGGTQQASMSASNINNNEKAVNPNPPDGTFNVSLDPVLSWMADANSTEYEVYFGKDTLPLYATKRIHTDFDSGAMEPNTQYYWRVDILDTIMTRTIGNIWTFTTGSKPLQAYNPSPADGMDNVQFDNILTWTPGLDSIAHNVYLSTNFEDVNNATLDNPLNSLVSYEQDSNYYNPALLEFNQTFYWRIDEISDNDIITKGNVWMFSTDYQPAIAYNPYPSDLGTGIDREVILSWSPGLNAVSYDVYFGTDFNDVNRATFTNPLNVLVSEIQDANFYEPDTLDYEQIYYWRIDEIDSNGFTTKGDIWLFVTEPFNKGRSCFIGQTPVMVDGSSISIASASIGQSMEDNSSIEAVQVHQETFTLYDILLESGNYITVAENHIFMTDDGKWLSLHNLKASMKLKNAKGSIGIKSITKQTDLFTGKVYNLKIKDSDQYMVGEDLIIVRDY